MNDSDDEQPPQSAAPPAKGEGEATGSSEARAASDSDPSHGAHVPSSNASGNASSGVIRVYPPPPAHTPARGGFFPSPALAPASHQRAPLVLPDAPAAEHDPFAGLTAIGPVHSERKARDWALVLQSMSLWHILRRADVGWVVLVRDEDYAAAVRSIDGYEAENRDWPPKKPRERLRHPSSPVVPIVFLALLAFFFVTGPSYLQSPWFVRGTAVAERVLHSEPWLAVTALTLHADSVHVLGNAISGTIFMSAVQRRIGSGGAALAVLASGALGNLANAFYYQFIEHEPHRSIGASTAVFGAIGLLAATQLVVNRSGEARKRSWTEIASPLVGGVVLLGTLGAGGERTDIGAHVFGFLAGVLIGLLAAVPLRRGSLGVDFSGSRGAAATVQFGVGNPRWWVQVVLGALATGLVLGSWILALKR